MSGETDYPLWVQDHACHVCGAALSDGILAHRPGCEHGDDLTAAVERDGRWFLDHRGVDRYEREATPAEVLEVALVRAADSGVTLVDVVAFRGLVAVEHVGLGIVARCFDAVQIDAATI